MNEYEIPEDIPAVVPYLNKHGEFIAECPYCEAENEIYPIDYDLAYKQDKYSLYTCWSCDSEFYVGPKEKNLENKSQYENL